MNKYTFTYIVYDLDDNEGPEQTYVAYAANSSIAQDEFDDWLFEQPFSEQASVLTRQECEA